MQTYAAFAEIFGALTIIAGGYFALVQISEIRQRRQYQAAADLCRGLMEPDLARAITLIRALPDDIRLKDLRALGPEYEDAAQIIGMTYETMGLLVHKRIASFQIVQQLTGGLLLMLWRKIRVWAKDSREEQNNPRFAEWIQWLAERIQDSEPDMKPAYTEHANWKRSK